MDLGFIKPAWIAVRNFTVAHSTTILTSVGVAGVVGTAVSASVASVKSYKAIQEAEKPNEKGVRLKLTPKEKIKLCWKYYIPTAVTGAATISAVVGSNVISGKKEAAMASALALAEKGFEEYKDVVAEKLGAEEEKALKDDIIFDKIASTNSEDIKPDWVFETHGKTLCYDYYCGRYFYSDPAYLRSKEAEINRIYMTEGIIYLQQMYDEIGLISTNWLERQMAWESDAELIIPKHDTLSFMFDSKLTADNKPVLVVRMNRDPKFIP